MTEKTRPPREAGMESHGSLWGVDGLHNKHHEWEPEGAFREALGGLPLVAGPGRGDDLAGHLERLRPHAEEALGTLARLEQSRGLSDGERTRAEALRGLLAATGEVR